MPACPMQKDDLRSREERLGGAVRCHTQFKMVESMEAQAAEYEAIVRKYAV